MNKYHRHIGILASQHRVLVFIHGEWPRDMACADPVGREVHAAPITDEAQYAVVLHEMGHICHPHEKFLKERERIRTPIDFFNLVQEEDRAWEWARSVAMEWTTAMEMVHRWARYTYTESFRHQVESMRPKAALAKKAKEWK